MRLIRYSGTTPAVSASAAGATKSPAAETRSSVKRRHGSIDEPLRVLIAEDNDVNQRVLQRQLHARSDFVCTTTLADNGLEALQRIERGEPFDVVLMDVEMPVMDGLEATQRIREHERQTGRPPVPIVGLSGNARDVHVQAGLAAGMNAYIAKPYTRAQVLDAIQQATAAVE
eukprot:Unigene5168_Nuclearia_a/m.15861 Unigene5168_Nuclearia_a/g.15861  ORF Unigene5168_Nuclearia_a/g.15861 Unigene5168_Nuclearia_a/m.15861 type:complete len:172 (+) Unigene5168_Nuclearia_a:638-1153(+)